MGADQKQSQNTPRIDLRRSAFIRAKKSFEKPGESGRLIGGRRRVNELVTHFSAAALRIAVQ